MEGQKQDEVIPLYPQMDEVRQASAPVNPTLIPVPMQQGIQLSSEVTYRTDPDNNF